MPRVVKNLFNLGYVPNDKKEPTWMTKIHNSVLNLERWITNLKQDKEQYELITEYMNMGRLEEEPEPIRQQILSQYDRYKTHDYDTEIAKLEDDLSKCRKKYKEALVKYKIWELNKDFQ